MLRLATPDYLRFCQATEFTATFGGGEANVAVSAGQLRTQTGIRHPRAEERHCGELPQGVAQVRCGDFACGLRRRPSGHLFSRNGAVARPSKVVYDRAYSAIAEIKPGMIDWEQVLAGADWFH